MNSTLFEKELLKWYTKNGRKHLPWRKTNITPYEVWVSEIMLQQTQVSRVIDFYIRFLEKFPTIFELADCDWEEFYPYYAGLGYYNRGRSMLRCAKIIVDEYKGKFPSQKEQLLSLPGIGEYTASAILSFGFQKNELAVDTNVKKVLGRVFYGSKETCIQENKLQEVKKQLLSKKKNLNAALMDFSNRVCLKVPRCGECPLQNFCHYFQTDGQKEVILPKKKQDFSGKEASVYVFLHKNHKEYYSTNKKFYKPFYLKNTNNTRQKIKLYFQKKYGMEISVRPPHKKILIDGKPVMLVNAQILVGKNPFYICDIKEKNIWQKRLM